MGSRSLPMCSRSLLLQPFHFSYIVRGAPILSNAMEDALHTHTHRPTTHRRCALPPIFRIPVLPWHAKRRLRAPAMCARACAVSPAGPAASRPAASRSATASRRLAPPLHRSPPRLAAAGSPTAAAAAEPHGGARCVVFRVDPHFSRAFRVSDQAQRSSRAGTRGKYHPGCAR